MGPGIDFPLVMAYKGIENPTFMPYFYFLNGHGDVTYFADSNFTEDQIESYEYNPWGKLFDLYNRNNILFLSSIYVSDINLIYMEKRYFSSILGRYKQKANTKFLNGFLYSHQDDLNHFYITNINYLKNYEYVLLSDLFVSESAWWPIITGAIVACVIFDAIKNCAAHCRESYKDSGRVEKCKDYPCGICIAEGKGERK